MFPALTSFRAIRQLHAPTVLFQHDEPQVSRMGWLALTLSLITGSTYTAFAKQLSPFLTPLTMLFVNQAIIALFTLFTFGLIPSTRRLIRTSRQEGTSLLAVALLGGALGPILWFTGLSMTTAVNATLFSRLQLIFVMGISFLFLGERFTKHHGVSVGLVLFGILFVTLKGFTQSTFSLQRGDLFILLSSISYATASIIFNLHLQRVPIQTVIFSRSLAGIASFFLLSPFLQVNIAQEVQAFPLPLVQALLIMCLVGQFIPLFTYYEAIEAISISNVTLFLSLDVLTSAAFAHWYLHEPLTWYHFVGGLLILLGTLWLQILGVHAQEEQPSKQVLPQTSTVS